MLYTYDTCHVGHVTVCTGSRNRNRYTIKDEIRVVEINYEIQPIYTNP
jgi:hypothetical protein